MLIKVEDVIWPLRLVYYVSPFHYAIKSVNYEVFVDTPPYSGTVPCNTSSANPACNARGFECPTSPLICWGSTGVEILDSVHENYAFISSSDDTWNSVAFLFVIAAFFKVPEYC